MNNKILDISNISVVAKEALKKYEFKYDSQNRALIIVLAQATIALEERLQRELARK